MATLRTKSANGTSSPSPFISGEILLVAELLDQFLDWVKHNLNCYEWHRQFLQKFAEGCGRLRVSELKPIHVTTSLVKKSTWGHSARDHLPPACEQKPEPVMTFKASDIACATRLGGHLRSYSRRAA
jgi:hypothetical protein